MTDNSSQRLHDVFFYGLYMDPDILRQKGVEPRNPRIASVDNYSLRIGNMATLLRDQGARTHGIVYSLTHAEIDLLYRGSGLDEYAAEALQVSIGGVSCPVLCCNLIEPPAENESNDEYSNKLRSAMEALGVPIRQ